MSRQLKFRAWNVQKKQMYYTLPYRGYIRSNGSWWKLYNGFGFAVASAVFDDELMQYIGLKDKNGVEIYEGDIVSCRAGEHLKGIWEYEKQFIVEYGWSQSMREMSLCDEIEVIGNIYENPDLLIKEREHGK